MTGVSIAGRPTWAEINLGDLIDNYRVLNSLLIRPEARGVASGSCPRPIPVIKANAYGHGATPVARALAAAGAGAFAVAIVEEGIALREDGITQDILVLEGAWPGQERELIDYNLISGVHSLEGLTRLTCAARSVQTPIPIHVKIDTGMARLGFRWDRVENLAKALNREKQLHVAGVFSHLSSADEADPAYTLEQICRFRHAITVLQGAGIYPGEVHLANSAGLLYFDALRQFSARPGIALYGYPPAPVRSPVRLRPVLSLKSRIGRIQEIAPGEAVGYNRRFVAERRTMLATLPVGYADGYRRSLTGLARVIIRDQWAKVVGTISMDMIIADITDLPNPIEGEEVILLGSSSSCCVNADVWAGILGTIPYEILCGISPRIPRVYI